MKIASISAMTVSGRWVARTRDAVDTSVIAGPIDTHSQRARAMLVNLEAAAGRPGASASIGAGCGAICPEIEPGSFQRASAR
jgi:hypothetical protein